MFFLSFTACVPDREEAPQKELQEEKIINETYGQHERHNFHVFLPKGRTAGTPVVILIHGGFWVEGDKNDFVPIQQQLLNMNIASVNMNYRYVSPDNDYRGLMEDVGQALDKVKEKAEDWGIRGGNYHLVGFSAGGHIALLYGYGFRQPGEVASVVSVAGPSGFNADLLTNPVLTGLAREPLEWLAGAPVPAGETDPNYAYYLQAGPISYVAQAVPTLMIHGSADELVPFSQSQLLKTALDERQVHNKLVRLEGASHDISAAPLDLIKALLETRDWVSR